MMRANEERLRLEQELQQQQQQQQQQNEEETKQTSEQTSEEPEKAEEVTEEQEKMTLPLPDASRTECLESPAFVSAAAMPFVAPPSKLELETVKEVSSPELELPLSPLCTHGQSLLDKVDQMKQVEETVQSSQTLSSDLLVCDNITLVPPKPLETKNASSPITTEESKDISSSPTKHSILSPNNVEVELTNALDVMSVKQTTSEAEPGMSTLKQSSI